MWFFNKKKLLKEEKMINKQELTNEQKVIKVLNNVIKGSIIKDDIIYIEDIKLTIEAHVPKVNEGFLQVVFVLNNDKFSEPFVESVAGIGKTVDHAIQQAVASFSFSALCGITNALRDEEGIDIETAFYDKTKKFKLYKSCKSAQGEKISVDSVDYWDMLGEEIKKRLGNKKVYWIKIYAAKTENSVSCECRINGLININITKIINQLAEKWEIKNPLYSEKQFLILIQDESTYVPYKFTKEQVNKFIDEALVFYGKCDTNEKYTNLINEIYNITQDMNLTNEIYCFLPEIFCELVCHEVSFKDEFTLLQGEKKTTIFNEQLTSYNWIYDNIGKKFGNNQLTQEQIRNIVTCSASFNAINDALNQDSKMEDLCMTTLDYNFWKDYTPF